MFNGTHSVTIDAKGRFAIPASFRQTLQDNCGGCLVVLPHWDGYLWMFPKNRYQDFAQQLMAAGGLDPQVRKYQRYFVGGARECEMDRQGRILLAAPQRAHALIETKAALIGIGNTFELWNEERSQAEQEAVSADLAEQATAGNLPDALRGIAL